MASTSKRYLHPCWDYIKPIEVERVTDVGITPFNRFVGEPPLYIAFTGRLFEDLDTDIMIVGEGRKEVTLKYPKETAHYKLLERDFDCDLWLYERR